MIAKKPVEDRFSVPASAIKHVGRWIRDPRRADRGLNVLLLDPRAGPGRFLEPLQTYMRTSTH